MAYGARRKVRGKDKVMISRIIIPLDRSELAEVAIPLGARLARCCDASVELVHVADEQEEMIQTYLDELPARFPELPPFRRVLRVGNAAEEILTVARGAGTL